jgi:hypothetical protein
MEAILIASVATYGILSGATIAAYARGRKQSDIAIVPHGWKQAIPLVLASELGTMIGWAWALSNTGTEQWADALAIVAQGVLIAWALVAMGPGGLRGGQAGLL